MARHFRRCSGTFLLRAAGLSALLLAAGSVGAGPAQYEQVTFTGEAAPGVPGAVFHPRLVFLAPTINNSGEVAFRGQLERGVGGISSANDDGLWVRRDGTLELVVLQGDPAPTRLGTRVFGTPNDPSISANGTLTFTAILDINQPGITFDNDEGIWSTRSGSIGLVSQEGDVMPGTSGAVTRQYLTVLSSASGQTTFKASLVNGIGDTTSDNDEGVWQQRPDGSLGLLMRAGDQAPGTAPGTALSFVSLESVNDAGQTAITGRMVNGTGDATNLNRSGIWIGDAEGMQLAVRAGTPAPFTEADTNFSGFGAARLNNAGHIVFEASTINLSTAFLPNEGIWAGDSSNLRLVAREDDMAPDSGGATFSTIPFDSPLINAQGDVAFTATIDDPTDGIVYGLYKETDGVLEKVVRSGDLAPGTSNGEVFASSSPYSMQYNSAGQIAFGAALEIGVGGVTNDTRSGWWATDTDGNVHLIARSGDLFDINDDPQIEELKTIDYANILFSNSAGQDGWTRGLTDSGDWIVEIQFTDNTSGLYVVTVPEPGSLALLLVGGGLAAGRRHHPSRKSCATF